MNLKKGLHQHSKKLAVQSWFWLTGFSACILAVLWVLQFALFNPFYYSLRRAELRRTGREIVQAYEEQSNFRQVLRQYAMKQNLRILLVDSAGWVLGNYDGFGTPFTIASGQVSFDGVDMSELKEDTSYLSTDTRGGSGRVVYIARVTPSQSGERYLYVASPIPPSDATRSVMGSQFLVITIVLLLLSAAGAWLLSRRISAPILRLTDSAKDLARGEFHAKPSPQDYDEIVQLSEELTRATQELTKAERYRQELVANVSHDLRTPLTIIRMYGEMLRDISGGDAQKRAAHCGKIIDESERLTDLVNELLELSKLEQTETVPLEPLRLDALVRETVERFHVLQEQNDVSFQLEIMEGVTVLAKADLLGRAVYNLIANAVNHVGDDRQVMIRLFVHDATARVEVIDHGQGIPPEELPHIWERYYKSQTHHQRGAGSGLGLSIVQTALRLHHAQYGAESQPGQGSMFWFSVAAL